MIWGQLPRRLVTRGAGSLNPRHFATLAPLPKTKPIRPKKTKANTGPPPSKLRTTSTSREPVTLRNPVLIFKNPPSPTFLQGGIDGGTMANFVHIVATPTADIAGPALLLHFDNRRYHFGSLPQGLQRAYVQRGYSMTKLERFIIAGTVCWDNMGGLLGLVLTVADALAAARAELLATNEKRKKNGTPPLPVVDRELDIIGGENLTYAIATARNFIFRQGLPINTRDLEEDLRRPGATAAVDWSRPDWEDDLVRVWSMHVSPERPSGDAKSPRKRSFDDMAAPEPEKNARRTSKEVCQAVVDDMFKSDWSRDRLVESRLGDVKLPARMWVRRDGNLHEYTGPLPSQDPSAADTMVFVREPWPSVKTHNLPPVERCTTSLSYIVKNRGRRGKFNPQVARELGVVPRDFKKLTAGETAQGKDGITVTPEMVLGEGLEGTGFAFLDVPSADYIESFLKRPEWSSTELLDGVHAFYWSLGRGVFDDARIQEFMKSRPTIKHVVMGPDISPNMITYEGFAGLLARLSCIDPDRFPVLNFDNSSKDISAAGPSAVVGRTGMRAKLLPNFEFDESQADPFPALDQIASLDPEVLRLAKEAREQVSQPEFQAAVDADEQDIPNRDAEVISLGTGSALPSKYRNVSATLIRVPGVGNYLLDCGENTIGQLRRMYSNDEFEAVMKDMRAIFVSHMHADHHLGMASILSTWHKLTSGPGGRKLTIISPPEMVRWIREFSCVEELGLARLDLIDARNTKPDAETPITAARLAASGLQAVQAVSVKHCHNSFAGVLTWPSGLKIAYSGDCRPSPAFAAAGRGATLLIHESTFDDEKIQDARAKRHCTMSEALDIAGQMRARRVLLTHFSQRYAKIPLLGERHVDAEGHEARDQVVLFAFDQMKVKIGEFKHAAAFLPAMRRLFDEESEVKEDGEDK